MFPKFNSICDKHKKVIEILFYVGFTLNIFYFFLRRTMFYVFMDALPWMGVLGLSMVLLFISALIEAFRCENIREFIADIILLATGALQYFIGGHYPIQFFMTFVIIAARRKNAKKALLIFTVVSTIIMIFVLYLSQNGYIYNQVVPKDNILAHALGTSSTTDCAADWFFILCGYVVLRDNNFKWFEYPLLFALPQYIYHLTGGLSATICSYGVLITCFILYALKSLSINVKINKKQIAIFDYSYLYAAILSFVMAIFFSQSLAEKMRGKLGSLQARLTLSHQALAEHPFSLFGANIEESGAGGIGNSDIAYFFIDNSYVRIYTMLGAVMFIIMMVLITRLLSKARKLNLTTLYFTLIFIAVDCLIEHHFMEYWCNIFISLALADWKSFGIKTQTIITNDDKTD